MLYSSESLFSSVKAAVRKQQRFVEWQEELPHPHPQSVFKQRQAGEESASGGQSVSECQCAEQQSRAGWSPGTRTPTGSPWPRPMWWRTSRGRSRCPGCSRPWWCFPASTGPGGGCRWTRPCSTTSSNATLGDRWWERALIFFIILLLPDLGMYSQYSQILLL